MREKKLNLYFNPPFYWLVELRLKRHWTSSTCSEQVDGQVAPGEALCSVVTLLVVAPTNLPCLINLIPRVGPAEVVDRGWRCEECADSHEISYFCTDWNLSSCDILRERHRLLRSRANHVIVPIDSVLSGNRVLKWVYGNFCHKLKYHCLNNSIRYIAIEQELVHELKFSVSCFWLSCILFHKTLFFRMRIKTAV